MYADPKVNQHAAQVGAKEGDLDCVWHPYASKEHVEEEDDASNLGCACVKEAIFHLGVETAVSPCPITVNKTVPYI